MFRKAATILIFSLITACVPAIETSDVQVVRGGVDKTTIARVQSDVRNMMRDPESAKFRDLRTYKSKFGDKIVCGQYDAKNGFGGYTGYSMYYARLRSGRVMSSYVDTSSNKYFFPAKMACKAAMSGLLPIPTSQVK